MVVWAQMATKSLVAAMNDFRAAVSLDPRCGTAWANMGALFLASRQWDMAADSLQRAVDCGHGTSGCLMNLALARAALNAPEEALALLNRVVALEPQWGRAFLNRGHVLAALGRDAAAEEDYGRSVQLMPLDSYAYAARAVVRGRMNRFFEAMQDHARALVLS
jgi:tetratricopeptide (TPR) repeat protein